MKKTKKIIACALIAFVCLCSSNYSYAKAMDTNKATRQVVTSHSHSSNQATYDLKMAKGKACPHQYGVAETGAFIRSDCMYNYYTYLSRCSLCGHFLETGVIQVLKDTFNHTYSLKSISCKGGTHTYQEACTSCGLRKSTFTMPCKGNCVTPTVLPTHIS